MLRLGLGSGLGLGHSWILQGARYVKVSGHTQHYWTDARLSCDSFSFTSDPDQHICELQLVHKSMFTARKHCNAHTAYTKFRTALELLETFELTTDAGHDTEARCDGEKDAADHRAFVHLQERDYIAFLSRYQQTVGIDVEFPKANVVTDWFFNTEPPSIKPFTAESLSTSERLLRELEQIKKRRHEDDKKIEQIWLQLKKL